MIVVRKILKIFLFLLVLLPFIPDKMAVNEPRYENYIICKMERETDSDWCIVDEDGKWIRDVQVLNDSDVVHRYGYEFHCANNTYYLYGNFTDEGKTVFQLECWDIKYPVKRNLFSFIPIRRFICQFDMWM